MADTYTQIHIQVIFVVKNRHCLIRKTWKDSLYKYITGIVQNHGHKVLAINGVGDHVHLFFGLRVTQSLSDLMRQVKGDSSEWINKEGFTKSKFRWQSGYAAFSYSKDAVKNVINYIKRQEEHHKKKTLLEEYLEFLDYFEVEYDERYLFVPVL